MLMALTAYRLIPISYLMQIKFNASWGSVNIVKLNREWNLVEVQ